jgi:hypothetical protein
VDDHNLRILGGMGRWNLPQSSLKMVISRLYPQSTSASVHRHPIVSVLTPCSSVPPPLPARCPRFHQLSAAAHITVHKLVRVVVARRLIACRVFTRRVVDREVVAREAIAFASPTLSVLLVVTRLIITSSPFLSPSSRVRLWCSRRFYPPTPPYYIACTALFLVYVSRVSSFLRLRVLAVVLTAHLLHLDPLVERSSP